MDDVKEFLESETTEFYEAQDVGLKSSMRNLPRKLNSKFDQIEGTDFESVFGLDNAELRIIVKVDSNVGRDGKRSLTREIVNHLESMGLDNVQQQSSGSDSVTVSITY